MSATSASRSSTNSVISAPPARWRCSWMYSDRSAATVQTTSVAFGKNEGSPRSRSYQARAAVTSRTRIPANSATLIRLFLPRAAQRHQVQVAASADLDRLAGDVAGLLGGQEGDEM